MLTIEHCDSVTIHFVGEKEPRTILGAAIEAGLRERVAAAVQTSATPPALGELWPGEGGRYAGTMPSIGGRAGYHLIVAEQRAEKIAFGPYNHDVAGAVDHYDGQANTRAIVADKKEHPAAAWALGIEVDELSDYYLPAHNELQLMWICVPQLFEKSGWYWSSTQYSPDFAWAQDFELGNSGVSNKYYELRAVAVRRLAL